MKARPTLYKGVQMRSRLEAQFAACLDSTHSTWQYEPMCFASEAGQYLPDFAVDILGERIYVEVKPTEDQAKCARSRMEIIRASEPRAHLVVVWPGAGEWCFIINPGPRSWSEILRADFVESMSDNLIVMSTRWTMPDKSQKRGTWFLHLSEDGTPGTYISGGVNYYARRDAPQRNSYAPAMIEADEQGRVIDTYGGNYFVDVNALDVFQMNLHMGWRR
jgi:hypothetical protein